MKQTNMITKMKNMSYQNKLLLGVFIISLIIFILTPIAGDDWGNYIVGEKGIKAIFASAVSMYKSWEGRFISRILIYFLTYHKWLWNILNATLITLFIKISYSIIGTNKNKFIYLIPIFGIITINYIFYTQCYLWVAGNITYLFPTVLSLLVFIIIYNNKMTNFKLIILLILSIIIPMFIENIGCAYVMFLFLIITYKYIKERKLNIPLLIMFILSITSLIIMLKSPGSAIRLAENQEFNNLSIFSKIITNIPNFISYAFTRNIIPLISMMIGVNIMLKNKIKNKFLIIIYNIIPIIAIFENLIYMIPINFEIKIIINVTNWYYIFYWITFGLLFIYSIYYHLKDTKERDFLLILMLTGIISLLVMLITPTWGERVSILYIWIIIIITSKIFSTLYKSNIKIEKTFKIFLILYVILILGYATQNKVFDIRRNNIINNSMNENKIYIYANKIYTLWNYDPWDEHHLYTFKKYYDIEEKEVELVYPTTKEWIHYMLYGKIKE